MLLVVIISVSFVFLVFSYYGKIMENADAASEELNRVYQYQYEMIVDSRNLTFWKDVYENAREEALKHGAVLEIKGLETGDDYDKADYMDMSIAAQVDGIILEYNGEEGIQEKIDEAVEKGIPVVTIVNDAPRSLRQSFVGINDYQMGNVYGAQVADLLDDETKRVEVLLNWETDLGQNQLYAQINSAVEKKSSGKHKIKIQSRNMMSHSQFDTEEEIRSIFQSEEGPPDILVCLDEVTTECAYQAMIDYNMVGEIKIIGYYTSKTIMDAVSKGLIPVTLSMDVKQIGAYRVYFIAYTNMGFLAGLAGLLTVARMTSAQPTYGQNYEMDAIGACFIGGASAYGGTGTVPGVIVGAVLMGIINQGMSIMGTDQNMQKVVKGAVLLAAVIFDGVSKRKSFIAK